MLLALKSVSMNSASYQNSNSKGQYQKHFPVGVWSGKSGLLALNVIDHRFPPEAEVMSIFKNIGIFKTVHCTTLYNAKYRILKMVCEYIGDIQT